MLVRFVFAFLLPKKWHQLEKCDRKSKIHLDDKFPHAIVNCIVQKNTDLFSAFCTLSIGVTEFFSGVK